MDPQTAFRGSHTPWVHAKVKPPLSRALRPIRTRLLSPLDKIPLRRVEIMEAAPVFDMVSLLLFPDTPSSCRGKIPSDDSLDTSDDSVIYPVTDPGSSPLPNLIDLSKVCQLYSASSRHS